MQRSSNVEGRQEQSSDGDLHIAAVLVGQMQLQPREKKKEPLNLWQLQAN